MQLERRQSPRIKLDHLAYINLPAANGGIVLDVSEGGLSFHSVVPIEATDVVRFRLAVGTIKNLEATASVAWLDSTRKSGGLQFTEPADGSAMADRELGAGSKFGRRAQGAGKQARGSGSGGTSGVDWADAARSGRDSRNRQRRASDR